MAKHVRKSEDFDLDLDLEDDEGLGFDEPFAQDEGAASADAADGFDDVYDGGPENADEAEIQAYFAGQTPSAMSAFEEASIRTAHRKSRRTRIVLIVVIVLLIGLIAGLGVLVYNLFQESRTTAAQQAESQQSVQDEADLQGENTTDTGSTASKRTEVPELVSLLGMTQDEAVEALAHGATVTATRSVNESGSAVKTSSTVTLTEEPADSRTGTPTVYLSLNADGTVIQAGYSAGTATLGYGALSFEDMVVNEQIIQKTFGEAGLSVDADAVVLPESRADYTTYASDGKTVTRESCSFDGSVELNGTVYGWDAVLLYDYAAANATGNLANTLRQIYVYVNLADMMTAADEPASEDSSEA